MLLVSQNLIVLGGPDGLCIEMFKAALDDIMPFLHVLFNNIFSSGIFSRKLV